MKKAKLLPKKFLKKCLFSTIKINMAKFYKDEAIYNNLKAISPITFDEHKLEIQEVTRKLEEKNIKDSVWIINKPRTKLKEHQEEFCRV